jgi:hypothetical protein
MLSTWKWRPSLRHAHAALRFSSESMIVQNFARKRRKSAKASENKVLVSFIWRMEETQSFLRLFLRP